MEDIVKLREKLTLCIRELERLNGVEPLHEGDIYIAELNVEILQGKIRYLEIFG